MSIPNQVFLRDYNRIYTGTNQSGGYDTPFLGFFADTTALTLKEDKSTYFHYPYTSLQLDLSASELIQTGAFAGAIPYRADKIFKKAADYKKHTVWGDSQPETTQRGTWLCAWLSGNDADPSQTPIWMDRWFSPGHFDATITSFLCSTSAVFDTPTRLTFDPGVWYRYDHVGDTTNLQIVSMLCALEIHVDDWAEISIDATGNGNNVILQNYTSSMISSGVNPAEKTDDNGLKLDGTNQYGSILYSTNYIVSGDLTCNVWVKSADWQNQPSHHFISNGLRGGWSIGVNNGFFTPYNVLIDKEGNIIFNNQTGDFYKDVILPGSPAPVAAAIDSELYTWILDNGVYEGYKHLYKMDYNGNIDDAVYFPSSIELYDLAVDQNNLVWVNSDQPLVSSFNTSCEMISAISLTGKKLLINNQNVLTAFNVTDACVYGTDDYWTVAYNGDVYYNNNIFLAGASATNIQATKDNVWALFDINKIAKLKEVDEILTGETTFVIDISAEVPGTISNTITGRNIFFTNEFDGEENSDYVWVLQPSNEYLYKYDTSLNLLQKINITYVENSIQADPVLGDTSGYQWHRAFNYGALEEEGVPQIEAVAYIGEGVPALSGQRYKAVVSTSDLSTNDWHMFTFSIDTTNSTLLLYSDVILRDTVAIPLSSNLFYKYETPILVGTNIGKINPLDEELNKINKIYHSGSFDDLRLYLNILNNSDIRHIYLTKYDFKDLIWNMPTGVQSYIEEIVRFFKFKMPGQKSQYYNIHLNGLQIENEDVRLIIEGIIKDTIQKIAPLYTSLYKIIWD